jgi:hypothetical protein
MNKTLLASLCALPLVACVAQDDSPKDIAAALPTSDQVTIKLPQSTSRMATSRTATALSPLALGQVSMWYLATLDATVVFNGGAGFVLDLIHKIVTQPATTVSGNTFTWGPGSDALSPTDYKLDVTAVGDGTFTYQLSGRSKIEANATFEVVISGTADPRKGDPQGNGTFSIDFDAGKRVNPTSTGTGTVHASYDLAAKHLDLTLDSTDALGQPVKGDYAYDAAADGGGQMVFQLSGNAAPGPANETISLRSRWAATGAGRADARIGGGDLGNLTATASECWDTHFLQVFYIDAVSNGGTLSASDGQPSACVFTDADLPAAP